MENYIIVSSESPMCEEPVSEEVSEDIESKYNTLLRLFIEMYESLPLLWNPSHPLYLDKAEREVALSKLATIYRKFKPGATNNDVRRKINSLRSNYNKDRKKRKSNNLGVTSERGACRPQSWMFQCLKFLDIANASKPLNESKIKEDKDISLNDNEMEQTDGSIEIDNDRQSISSIITQTVSLQPPAKKQKVSTSIKSKTNDRVNFERMQLASKNSEKLVLASDSSLPNIVKVWAEKLINLDVQQRLFAEKAINDILFEASLGSLDRNSVKINDPF